MFVGVAIAILSGIRYCLPKEKEGFLDANQTGVVITSVALFVGFAIGFGYVSYSIKD